jgi:hypothetical protein
VDKYSRMFDSGRKASSISTNSAVNNVWVRKISSPPRETVSPKKSSENQMFTGFPMKHQPSTKTSVGRQQEIVRENDVLNNVRIGNTLCACTLFIPDEYSE